MIPVIVITLYLVAISYIGSVAFRKGKENTEDFFLASRTIGSVVFFLSLFATNMTAFAILGSSGAAYKQGIGIFGMMASASGIVIPLTIFFIGTRLWSLGKRFGHITQVQLFRDRWECGGIGTFIFALTAAMLIPYMIISIIGGGQVLQDISVVNGSPLIPYWLGCLIVTAVVTINVFFGGMRGVVWVNVFQTILFVLFGTVAFITISTHLPGGLSNFLADMAGNPVTGSLLSREKMPAEVFWSYMFIPLSSIMFPHMAIMCLSARKMSAFKQTVVVYPVAIMAIWLPCVFLGVIGAQVIPGLKGTDSDGILLQLLTKFSPTWLAGLLGAGIISAVMGSDCHQVLALSTMFTKDIFAYYGGTEKYGEKGMVSFARIFVIIVTVIAYFIALAKPTSIFELAIRFAFSGYAALAPVMIAALFWKRSTKYGALASTVWVAFCMVFVGYLTNISDAIAPKPPTPAAITRQPRGEAPTGAPSQVAQAPDNKPTASPTKGTPAGAKPGGKPKGPAQVQIFPALGNTFLRSPTQVTVFGFLPVVPMVLGSALLMIIVSLLTRPPSPETVRKYFPSKGSESV
jgi:SSS family solute:Na+ symporter